MSKIDILGAPGDAMITILTTTFMITLTTNLNKQLNPNIVSGDVSTSKKLYLYHYYIFLVKKFRQKS